MVISNPDVTKNIYLKNKKWISLLNKKILIIANYFISRILRTHQKDYPPQPSQLHPRDAEMVQRTWIHKCNPPHKYTKGQKPHGHLITCGKGLWSNPTLLYDKSPGELTEKISGEITREKLQHKKAIYNIQAHVQHLSKREMCNIQHFH